MGDVRTLTRGLVMAFRARIAAFLTLILCFVGGADLALATKVDILVSKPGQKMTVRVDGVIKYVWPVSTGAQQYETPAGTWKPFRMEAEHFSKEWDDAPMPHSIFFTGEGHAIHGSYHVKTLGRKASHGCVRLAPENATILFGLVQKAGMSNTTVTIKGGFFDGGGYTTASASGGRPWWLRSSPNGTFKRSFSDVGKSMDKTINPAPKKPKKVAMKCTTKDGKKVCKKPFVLFGSTAG
jgi:lipoprotein-anchoring transpeptidase ErfK/SrfK